MKKARWDRGGPTMGWVNCEKYLIKFWGNSRMLYNIISYTCFFCNNYCEFSWVKIRENLTEILIILWKYQKNRISKNLEKILKIFWEIFCGTSRKFFRKFHSNSEEILNQILQEIKSWPFTSLFAVPFTSRLVCLHHTLHYWFAYTFDLLVWARFKRVYVKVLISHSHQI